MIKIACASVEEERCSTGLAVAAAAVAAGVDVSLWLASDAVWLAAAPDLRPEPIDPELDTLAAAVLGVAPVSVCARCADRRGITAEALQPGAEIAGATAYVAAVTRPDVQALVY